MVVVVQNEDVGESEGAEEGLRLVNERSVQTGEACRHVGVTPAGRPLGYLNQLQKQSSN